MASQQRFEGPVLEDLLERVRAEVGASARIVAANRVRKGGVGGFFSRQAFEVLVEPADPTRTPAPTTPSPTATPATTTPAVATPTIATPKPNPATAPTAATIVEPAPVRTETRAPLTILELADAVSADERNDVIDLVEERSLSTQSRDFAQVLDRVSRSIDATPDELRRDVEAPPETRTPETRTPETRTTEEIDLRMPDRRAASYSAPTAPPPPLPNEPGEPAPPPSDHDHHHDDHGDNFVVTTLDSPATRRAVRPIAPAEVIDRYETRLSKMGLPARLIPRGIGQHGLKGALVESLFRLPPAPSVPAALGVVIATVGVGATPVLLARDLATELGIDPDDVMLATREPLGGGIPAWLQMSDPATAEERRLSWRRRARPTIVAFSLPTATRGLSWARDMLDHLEPTVTWAIVDAGWKREDIAFRVEELGGVDVLALEGLDETVSPATALEIGVPVGRLDQEHASPLTWTELFLERLQS